MANTATSMHFVDDGGRAGFSDGPNNRFTFGQGDFTIEFWGQNTDTSSTVGWFCYFLDANNRYHLTNYANLEFYSIVGGSSQNLAFVHARDTIWHHYAVVRTGSHLGVWVDGKLIASNDSYTINLSFSGGTMLLGVRTDNGSDFTSYSEDVYMDEFRVSRSARYGNIDIPTTIIKSHQVAGRGTNDIKPDDTSLLITSNGTSTTSDTIVDETGISTLTVTGAVRAQTQTYLGNTSINFDGTDDKLTFTSPAFAFGTDDFSIEYWAYWETHTNYNTVVATQRGTNGFNMGTDASSDIVWYDYTGSGTRLIEVVGAVPLTQWTHQAWSRINGVMYVWQDGVLKARAATSMDYTNTVSAIGCLVTGTAATNDEFCDFNLDSMRVTKGKALYTPHFTPYGGQKNVVHNRGGAVTDARLASANTHAIQMGRAAIGSDAATNANTYCLDFNGTNQYLKHDISDWRGDDDRGTIFAWIYVDEMDGEFTIFSKGSTASNDYQLAFYVKAFTDDNTIAVQQKSGTTGYDNLHGTTQMSAGTWNSVAITSDGTSYAMYINGTAETLTTASGTNSGDWFGDTTSTTHITIGTWLRSSAVDLFDGKIMQLAYFGSDGTGDGTNGVLTAAQIAALHSAGKEHDLTTATGVYTAAEIDDLKGYWRMGNHYLDTPKTIYDASGNGYDMHEVSDPAALTYTTGTTFLNNWQHRGYFTPDKYTSLLIQSSTNEGATSFQDTGPGFKRVSFDGTNDFVKTFPDSADWDLGTGDFCVATWVKISDNSTNYTGILTFCDGTSVSSGWGLGFTSGDEIAWWNNLGSNTRTVTIPSASYPSNGTWNFIVVSRTDFVTKIYLNGTEMDSQPDKNTYNAAAATGTGGSQLGAIGRFYPPEDEKYFKGMIAQLGFWKGSGLTASQISSLYALEIGDASWNSSPYSNSNLEAYYTFGNTTNESPADSGTNLYDRSTDSDQDLAVDGATAPFAGHTITASGPIHKTDKSVFGGSSMFFDGTNDYLAVPKSNDFEFGTGDITVEAWVHPTQQVDSSIFFASATGGPSTNDGYLCLFTSNRLRFYGLNGGSAENTITSAGTATANKWTHVAYTRIDGVQQFYLDGIPSGAAVASTADIHQTTATGTSGTTDGRFGIGYAPAGGYNYYKGYMDEFRVSSGIARYTKSIERYANTFVAKGDTGDAFTTLQIQSNGVKNGTGYSDGVNRTGSGTATSTIYNSPTWDTAAGDPFGGANTALHFSGWIGGDGGTNQRADGNADIVSFADGDYKDFGTEDWTVEGWFKHDRGFVEYLDSLGSTRGGYYITPIFVMGSGGYGNYANDNGWSLTFSQSTKKYTFRIAQSGNQDVNSLAVADYDDWHHVAVVRKNNNLMEMYIEGVLVGTKALSATTMSGTLAFELASLGDRSDSRDDEGGSRFGGWMDQIRLSKGIARYGKFQLRTTQQTHVSANADSGVVTSNSTFGSANNIFSSDGHTLLLLTGDEVYSNTHVAASANAFLSSVGNTNVSNVTTTYTVTVASGQKLDGTTGNIYYINGFGRPALTLVRDNHYIFDISDSDYSSHPFRLATGANGPNYTTGVVVDTSGTTTQIKFSPNSDSPDSLHYYCGSHNNMGFTASVVDSTGSDGVVAPTPIGVRKNNGTTTANFPTQRQGISAYGANSYFFDGTNDDLQVVSIPSFAMEGDFTIEMWAKADAGIASATDIMFSRYGGSPDNGYQVNAFANGSCAFYHGDGSESWSAVTNPHNSFKDGEWHHLAAQRKGDIFSLFIDGTEASRYKNYGTVGRDNTDVLYIGNNQGGTELWHGHIDSFRISKGIARYGYSGTNAKLGTNAVHHSHAKLLITSNTFNGNTHFDDFSDQGNYWNQQPYGVYNHYTVEDWYIGTGTLDISESPAWTVAVWARDYDPALSQYQRIFQYGTNNSASTRQIWLLRTQSIVGQYQFLSSTTSVDYQEVNSSPNSAFGQLYEPTLVVGTFTNSGTDNQKIYVNGILGGTATQAGNTPAFGGTNQLRLFHGQGEAGIYRWQGYINQLAFWDSELSASQIQTMWENGPTANWSTASYGSDLVHYWGMGNHDSLGGRPADSSATIFDRVGSFDLSAGPAPGTTHMNPSRGNRIRPYGTVKHTTDRKHKGSTAIFFDGDSDYLEMMPYALGPASTTCDFTFEAWVAFTGGDSDCPACIVTSTQTGNSNEWYIRLDGSDYLNFHSDSLNADLATSVSAYDTIVDNQATWHHVVGQRKATKCELYLDGIKVADSGTTGTGFTAGGDRDMVIGKREWSSGTGSGQYWKGYMDEIAYYHGVAKYNPVATGLGTATITPSYLSDPTGNHFTTNGLAITDQMLDSPENNFCTWNPLLVYAPSVSVFSEGNLKVQTTNADPGYFGAASTIGASSGKWYCEVKAVASTSPSIGYLLGVSSQPEEMARQATTASAQNSSTEHGYYAYNGNYYTNGTNSSYGDAYTAGDIIGIAMDLDNSKLYFSKNGVWQVNDPATNSSTISLTSGETYFIFCADQSGAYFTFHANFGQGDPDGENNFTDSNGRGGFRFEPPQGFVSLCTANLKDNDYAKIGPNSAAGTPDKHFDILLYSGTNMTASNDPLVSSRRISGLNFQPDLVLIKNRSTTDGWSLQDSVRGWEYATKLSTYDTSHENKSDGGSYGNYGFVSGAFDGGFEICPGTSPGQVDGPTGENFAAWCWKAGNETTINNDGTHQTTVSVNKDAGFSISTYTGDVSGTSVQETIGHGLDETPEFVIVKDLTNVTHWRVYHKGLAAAGATATANSLFLNTTDAQTASAARIADVNATTITLGGGTDDGGGVIGNGRRHVAYAWHSVEGYSKIGSYEANNNADGPFVYLGFKPAWVMIKSIDGAHNWWILDNKRNLYNPTDRYLLVDSTAVTGETTPYTALDFLSNGFKVRNTSNAFNSATHIYIAFAEMPFKYANAR